MAASHGVLRALPSLDGAEGSRQADGGREGREGASRRTQLVDAALSCVALCGVTKTTVDDVAKRAGLSRATVYRVFPGGKDELLAAVVDTEVARLFSALGVRMGQAGDLADVLVVGIEEAATRLHRHEALSYLVAHEPDVVLGHLAFDHADRLLEASARFTAPFLARWMDPEEALRVAEWAARIVLSYSIAPSEAVDLTRADHVRHLIETFVLPGIRARDGEEAEAGTRSGERLGPIPVSAPCEPPGATGPVQAGRTTKSPDDQRPGGAG